VKATARPGRAPISAWLFGALVRPQSAARLRTRPGRGHDGVGTRSRSRRATCLHAPSASTSSPCRSTSRLCGRLSPLFFLAITFVRAQTSYQASASEVWPEGSKAICAACSARPVCALRSAARREMPVVSHTLPTTTLAGFAVARRARARRRSCRAPMIRAWATSFPPASRRRVAFHGLFACSQGLASQSFK